MECKAPASSGLKEYADGTPKEQPQPATPQSALSQTGLRAQPASTFGDAFV